MASTSSSSITILGVSFVVLIMLSSDANAQLSTEFYAKSCPKLFETVKSTVDSAISKEARMGASLLRLFFHDCFVNVQLSLSLSLYQTCYLTTHKI